jgi:hypothetical protein
VDKGSRWGELEEYEEEEESSEEEEEEEEEEGERRAAASVVLLLERGCADALIIRLPPLLLNAATAALYRFVGCKLLLLSRVGRASAVR